MILYSFKEKYEQPIYFFLKVYFIFTYVLGGGLMHMSEGSCGNQKRTSDSQGLELQADVHHMIWVLETKLRSSRR